MDEESRPDPNDDTVQAGGSEAQTHLGKKRRKLKKLYCKRPIFSKTDDGEKRLGAPIELS